MSIHINDILYEWKPVSGVNDWGDIGQCEVQTEDLVTVFED